MRKLIVRHPRAFSLYKKAKELSSKLGGILLGPDDNIIIDYPADAIFVMTANNLDVGIMASTFFQVRRSIFYAIAEGRPKLHPYAREIMNSGIVVAPSRYAAEKIEEGGVNVDAVIYFAVPKPKIDFEKAVEFRERFQGKLILWLGANMYRKGLDLLFELAEYMPEYTFYVITGPGDIPLDTLNRKNIIVNDKVFNIKEEELAAMMYAADAFIMTTRNEGFGLPAVEAALVGTPPVVPEHPVLKEILDDCAYYYPVSKVRKEDFFGLMEMEYYEPDISLAPEAIEKAIRGGVGHCVAKLAKRFTLNNYLEFMRFLW